MNDSSATNVKGTTAQIENKAKVFATFFCWQKKEIPKDLFTRYWRDVHAIWAARSPGFYQYRQLHLDKVDRSLLAGLTEVETDLPTADQPDGIAHIAYSSKFIANLLRKPFALKQADEDNAIFVSRNSYQQSVLPVSRTIVDKIDSSETNGPLKNARYVLAMKRQPQTSLESFRKYVSDTLCEGWSRKDGVSRLRLEIMEPHINAPDTPKGVGLTWDEDEQYQAWIELALAEGVQLADILNDDPELKKHVAAIHTYPIREIYTIVFDGKPTLVGLRGYEAAKTIEAANADFQKSRQVLSFTYGDAINGGRLIPKGIIIGLLSVLISGTIVYLLF